MEMRYILGTITLIGCIIGLYFIQTKIEQNHADNRVELSTERIIGTHTYEINKPDHTFTLTTDLQEISGLAYVPESAALLAIQDENGIIYRLDKQTGTIIDKIKFNESYDDNFFTVQNMKRIR